MRPAALELRAGSGHRLRVPERTVAAQQPSTIGYVAVSHPGILVGEEC
jgi:hypothetical protein